MRHFQVYGASGGEVRWREVTPEVEALKEGLLGWDPSSRLGLPMDGMVHFFTMNISDEKVAYGPRS